MDVCHSDPFSPLFVTLFCNPRTTSAFEGLDAKEAKENAQLEAALEEDEVRATLAATFSPFMVNFHDFSRS